MLLSAEVDDPARANQCALLGHQHLANPDLATLGGVLVRAGLSGNVCLNINAMPLPMTPTSLTVFTRVMVLGHRTYLGSPAPDRFRRSPDPVESDNHPTPTSSPRVSLWPARLLVTTAGVGRCVARRMPNVLLIWPVRTGL